MESGEEDDVSKEGFIDREGKWRRMERIFGYSKVWVKCKLMFYVEGILKGYLV